MERTTQTIRCKKEIARFSKQQNCTQLRSALVILFLLIASCGIKAEETGLFNSAGQPVAYIDTSDPDMTIYLWNGTPVAYLSSSNNGYYNIFGFNGKHLGWYTNGVISDHNGYMVGFRKGAIDRYTQYEPYKSYKKRKPNKSYQQYIPYKPSTRDVFSSESLSSFLTRGRK